MYSPIANIHFLTALLHEVPLTLRLQHQQFVVIISEHCPHNQDC